MGDSSSTWMAAVVIAIAHKHTVRFKEQSILTSRAVFANRIPRIDMLNRKKDSTACVCGEREGFIVSFFFFFYIFKIFCRDTGLFFTFSASINALFVGNGN